jgi:hypothetical protein
MRATIENLVREACDAGRGVEKTASSVVKNDVGKLVEYLEKAAALPYEPDAREAIAGLMKLASKTIESETVELQKMKDEVAYLTKVATIRSMIDGMIEIGLINQSDVFEKSSELIKKDDRGLEIVKEAMHLAGSRAKNIFDDASEDSGVGAPGKKREMFEGCF